ncbi:MAG: hypothetical protein K6G15_06950 [Desulfovibrio sp.]|nr:hypothetical protein [Desulfovibrio sp.]
MLALLLLVIFLIALAAWYLLLTRSEHRNLLASLLLHKHSELYEKPSLLNQHFAQSGQGTENSPMLPALSQWPKILRSLALPLLLLILLACSIKFCASL